MASASSVPVDRNAALAPVRPPAVAIAIVAGLGLLGGFFTLAWHALLGASLIGMDDRPEGKVAALLTGGLGIAITGFGLILHAAALFGALRMYQGRSYVMAWIAAVLVALPCSGCCCLGLPIAIWTAVVLLDDNVKNAFA
jgi:hypothetical protein